jgi:hypothetical protein
VAEGVGVACEEGDAVGTPVGCGVRVGWGVRAGRGVRVECGVPVGDAERLGVADEVGPGLVVAGDWVGTGPGEVEDGPVGGVLPRVAAGGGLNST